MILRRFEEQKLIQPPRWLVDSTQFVTVLGSQAYGTATETSDLDIFGFCIPPKDMIFPHLGGELIDFGKQKPRFREYEQQHVYDPSTRKEHDFKIYSIVRYFHLLMENNPNFIDSLFVSQECILHCTAVGNMVRDARKMFLHKGCWPKFKGYAYSQLHKMSSKESTGKRLDIRTEFGFDVKFAMHTVRLLSEAEQILTEGNIDLRRNNEHLKAIRRGDVSEQDIRRWAAEKESTLEKAYVESKLPWGPDEKKIKLLLIQCLEHHYGSLDKCVVLVDEAQVVLSQIESILNDYNSRRRHAEVTTS